MMFQLLILLFSQLPSTIHTAPLDPRATLDSKQLRGDETEEPADLVQGNVTQLPAGSTFSSNYFNCSGLVSAPDPTWYMGETKIKDTKKFLSARSSCYQAAEVVCGNFSVNGEAHLGQWTNSTYGDCWVGIFYPPKAIGLPTSKERCLEQIFGPMIDTCVNQTMTLPSAPAGNLAAAAPDGSIMYRHYDEGSINIRGGDQDISQGWVYDANWPAYLVMSVNESLNYTPSASTATAPPAQALTYSDHRYSSPCNIWDPQAACNKALSTGPPMPATTQGSPSVSYNYGSGSTGGTATAKHIKRRIRGTVRERQEEDTTESQSEKSETASGDPSDANLFNAHERPLYNFTSTAYIPPPGGSNSGSSSGANYGGGSTGTLAKNDGPGLQVSARSTSGRVSPGVATPKWKRDTGVDRANLVTRGSKRRNATADESIDAVTAAAIEAQQRRQDARTSSPIPLNYNGLMTPGQSSSHTPTNPSLGSGASGSVTSGSTGSSSNFGEGSSGEKAKRQAISPFKVSTDSLFTPAVETTPGQVKPVSPISVTSNLYNPAVQPYNPAPPPPAVGSTPGTLSGVTSSTSGSGGSQSSGSGARRFMNRRQWISPFTASSSSLFKPADPASRVPTSLDVSPISMSQSLYDPNAQAYRPAPDTPATGNGIPGTLSSSSSSNGGSTNSQASATGAGAGGNTGGATSRRIKRQDISPIRGSFSSLFKPADPAQQGPGATISVSPITSSSSLYDPAVQAYKPAPGTPAVNNIPGTLSGSSAGNTGASQSSGSGGSSGGGVGARDNSDTAVVGRRVPRTFDA